MWTEAKMALAVAVGSAGGGVLRYAVARGLGGVAPAGIALSTLVVNCLGSAVFGVLMARQNLRPLAPIAYVGLTTGVLGGFTTYSTFNAELLRHLQAGRWQQALLYGAVTAVSCLVGAALGWWSVARA